MLSVCKKLLFWFFKRWNLALGKTKCAICVMAFLFQQDFSWIQGSNATKRY